MSIVTVSELVEVYRSVQLCQSPTLRQDRCCMHSQMAEFGSTSGQVQEKDERVVPSMPVATSVSSVMAWFAPVMTAGADSKQE